MNPTVKTLIGAAVGGAMGWFVGQVVVEYIHLKEDPFAYDETNEFDPSLDDDEEEETKMIDPSRFELKNYQKKEKQKKVPTRKDYSKIFGADKPELVELVRKYSGEGGGAAENAVDLGTTGIGGLKANLVIEDELEQAETGVIIEGESFDEPTDPSIITMQEYANAEDVSRTTLNYYEIDDILTNEKDHPLDRPERFLGVDALTSFDDDDVVYVYNRQKKAMYEIVRLHQAYSPSSAPKPRGKKGIDYDDAETDTDQG